ncbi:MAG: mandelate racemase/muconate lactonizing enzyme family protein [Gemmatimonadota bacterium]
MKITKASRICVHLPFYAPRVVAAMHRAQTHDERVFVYRIETDSGLVGWGDTQGQRAEVGGLVGRNPWSLVNDEKVTNLGVQGALLDVCGKEAGVPAHHLIGRKYRDRCPISWWDIDMPPQDWAAEAREAVKRGHTSFKMKARPWRDIIEQVDTVAKVVPPDFRFDIDFNGFLLTSARAEQILCELDERPNVGMYESPFGLGSDLEGARILRQRTKKFIVEHWWEPCLHAHACDGFVAGGMLHQVRRQDALAAAFNRPFWLQMVGAGLTTALAVHLGAVLSHAHLPYITCSELWEKDLLKKRLPVVDGYIQVPDGAGLGVEVDEKAVERYRVVDDEPTPKERYRAKKRILRVVWPAGPKRNRVWEFTDEAEYQKEFYNGSIPGFQQGVHLEVEEDDGSAAFKKEHARIAAREATVAYNRV